jgi:hypothetical protein
MILMRPAVGLGPESCSSLGSERAEERVNGSRRPYGRARRRARRSRTSEAMAHRWMLSLKQALRILWAWGLHSLQDFEMTWYPISQGENVRESSRQALRSALPLELAADKILHRGTSGGPCAAATDAQAAATRTDAAVATEPATQARLTNLSGLSTTSCSEATSLGFFLVRFRNSRNMTRILDWPTHSTCDTHGRRHHTGLSA